MSQPPAARSPGGGNLPGQWAGLGNVVVMCQGTPFFQLQVAGIQDKALHLDQQAPLVQGLAQLLATGVGQASMLGANGFSPLIAPLCLRPEGLLRDDPFFSPLGVPASLTWDADQHAKEFAVLDGFAQSLDQQIGGPIYRLTDGKQQLDMYNLLIQKGNLALWRFREGALSLFAEQASLYALAEPQSEPMLHAFQAAARGNLDVLRAWVLYQKYRARQPAVIDQATFAWLSQGRWQEALGGWMAQHHLTDEQAQAERQYLNAIGKPYDMQATQRAAHEAEAYFSEALRHQPDHSVALVNLAALSSESALLAYIETGSADRTRLLHADAIFQQARAVLDRRPDREGRIALAQCLLYEAVSLPSTAHLESVQWADAQAQQMRAALGPNVPESLRLDIVQRNLARRDPGFIDRKKIEQARDLLIGAGAMAGLIALAEHWLSAQEHMAHLIGEGLKAGPAQHPGQPGANPPGPAHPPPAVQHAAGKAAARSAQHKFLATVQGKIIAGVLAAVVAATGVAGAYALTRPKPPTHPPPTPTQQVVAVGKIAEFPLPTPQSGPYGITLGPDGNLWFTETGSPRGNILTNNIGRITPTGSISEFAIPTPVSTPEGIVAGPDGNLWFTETSSNRIGRLTIGGTFSEFILSDATQSEPVTITVGPDKNLWFTESRTGQIGSITPDGQISQFLPFNADNGPFGITAGPDGTLWFTEFLSGKIALLTPNGAVTEFPLPTAGSTPVMITAGPDGNLWFTENGSNAIGRITPQGTVTEFPLPTPRSQPFGIVAGPDGNLWFTEIIGNKIGRITLQGIITEFSLPTPGSQPYGIAVGPDKNLWFTEKNGDKIGVITSGKGTGS